MQVYLTEISEFANNPTIQQNIHQAILDYVAFYQLATDSVNNVNVEIDHGSASNYPNTGNGCEGTAVYDNLAEEYTDGSLGQQWVTDDNTADLKRCYGFHFVDNSGTVLSSGTSFVSAPYVCGMESESSSKYHCESGVVTGSTITKKDHCGSFDECYYYNGNLRCEQICVDNKYADSPKLGRWWS